MNPESLGTIVFVAAIGGFLCWVYYSTVLPSIRFCLRLDLFRLRDDLRQLVIDGDLSEEDEAFGILDTDLSSMVSGMSDVDIPSLIFRGWSIDRLEFAEFVKRRVEIVCTHRLQEIRRIDGQAMKTFAIAFCLNSLPMIAILIVPLLAWAIVQTTITRVATSVKLVLYEWVIRAALAGEDSSLRRSGIA